jgi:hypothetical protein
MRQLTIEYFTLVLATAMVTMDLLSTIVAVPMAMIG